jgi:hypothetical protein
MSLRLPIIIVLILLAGYGFLKAWPLLSGPEISLTTVSIEPADGFITLSGTTKHTETLTFDGGTLLIDEAGNFSKTLTLPRGGTELTFVATDRFGRSHSLQKDLVIP